MKIKCYAHEYIDIPEYMEIYTNDAQTYMIKLGDVKESSSDDFEVSDAEILGNICEAYESDTRCLHDTMKEIVDNFELGLIWEKVIFMDDEGQIIYAKTDNGIKISAEWNRKNKNSEQEKLENVYNPLLNANAAENIFSGLKEDSITDINNDFIIINGQKYCSFKKLEELTYSISPAERQKIIKSIEAAKDKVVIKQIREENIER